MKDFLFDQTPWEAFLDTHKQGDRVSAWNLLSVLEGEDDETVEEAFALLEEKGLVIDLSALPVPEASGQAAIRLKQEQEFIASGLNPAAMEENDPLRLYLEELAGIPAAGDSRVLAELAAAGNEDAAAALVNLELSRAVSLACEYAGRSVLLLDLIQEASIGLWQAVQSYTGGDYEAHRDRIIRNALAKAVLMQARSSDLCRKMREALQNYRSTGEKLLRELGRTPLLDEIADRMKISRQEAESVQKMWNDALLVQNMQLPEEKAQEEPEEDLAVEDTAYFQMRRRIEELLSRLSSEDAKLLTLRYGLENKPPMTAEETARYLGLTVGQVLKREAAALALLRS